MHENATQGGQIREAGGKKNPFGPTILDGPRVIFIREERKYEELKNMSMEKRGWEPRY